MIIDLPSPVPWPSRDLDRQSPAGGVGTISMLARYPPDDRPRVNGLELHSRTHHNEPEVTWTRAALIQQLAAAITSPWAME